MGKVVLRLDSEKKTSGIAQRYRHNMRIELPQTGHIDPTLSKNNVELIKMRSDVSTPTEFVKKRISELDYYKTHNVRKNAILANEVIMAFGTDNLPKDFSVANWAKQCEKFLTDVYGRENVLSAVVHMDEGAPHIHAIVMPIKDDKLSARALIGDRDGLRALHERYYTDYMKQCGLEPEDQGRTELKHGKLAQYYAALDKTFEESLPQMEPGESKEEYYKRVNTIYQNQMLVQFKQRHHIEQLSNELKVTKKNSRHKEAKLRREYEEVIEKTRKEAGREKESLLNQIGGSIEQAIDAIEFKDQYDAILTHTENTDPKKAEEFKNRLDDMERDYLADIEKEEEMER